MEEKEKYKVGTRYELGFGAVVGTYAGKSEDGERFLFSSVDDDGFYRRNNDGLVDFMVDWNWKEVTE